MGEWIDSGVAYIGVGFQIKAAVEIGIRVATFTCPPQYEVYEGIDSIGCHIGVVFQIIAGSKKWRRVTHLRCAVVQVMTKRISGDVWIALKVVTGIKETTLQDKHTVQLFTEYGDFPKDSVEFHLSFTSANI
jgi:hypothetical protein